MPINLNNAGSQRGNFDLLPPGIYHFEAIVIAGGAGTDGFLRREKKTPRVLMLELECKVVDNEEYAGRRVWDYIPVEIDESTNGDLAPIPADALSKAQSRVRRGRAKLLALLDSAFELQPNDDSVAAQKKRELDSYGAVHGLQFYAQVEEQAGSSGYEPRNRVDFIITPDLPDWPKQPTKAVVKTTAPAVSPKRTAAWRSQQSAVKEYAMPRLINVTRLSQQQRGFLVGYRRARARARKEMNALAADYDMALASLQTEFRELALAHHRKCLSDAIDEAWIERSTNPFQA